jgi:hypothetical protein
VSNKLLSTYTPNVSMEALVGNLVVANMENMEELGQAIGKFWK